jgi:hypothetical protein
MKELLLLLLTGFLSTSWTTISPDASLQLSNAALSRYLSEMETNFNWTPPILLVKSEQPNAQQLQRRIGKTQILIKNETQLLAYSLQHTGKALVYLNLDIEQEHDHYYVYMVNEGLKTVLKEGVPQHELIEAPLGRACVLHYDHNLKYVTMDCLLSEEDAEKE